MLLALLLLLVHILASSDCKSVDESPAKLVSPSTQNIAIWKQFALQHDARTVDLHRDSLLIRGREKAAARNSVTMEEAKATKMANRYHEVASSSKMKSSHHESDGVTLWWSVMWMVGGVFLYFLSSWMHKSPSFFDETKSDDDDEQQCCCCCGVDDERTEKKKRSMRKRTFSLPLTLLAIILSSSSLSPVDAGSDYCSVLPSLANRSVIINNALAGKTLRTVIGPWDVIPSNGTWSRFTYDPKTKKFGGYLVDVLNMAASAGGFNYTIELGPPLLNLTTTQWLIKYGSNYDMVVGGWADTLARRDMGFFQPWGIFDFSMKLVTLYAVQDTQLVDRFFSFLNPFTSGLWGVILALVVVTGTLHFLFERQMKRSEDYKYDHTDQDRFGRSLLIAVLMFTNANSYKPASWGARLIALSWAFTVLIFVASYTASLASFLVVQSGAQTFISSIDDAISKRSVICVQMNSQDGINFNVLNTGGMMRSFDTSGFSMEKIRDAIINGDCEAALFDSDTIQNTLVTTTYNIGCQLKAVGVPMLPATGGFLVSLYTSNCQFVVRDSLAATFKSVYDSGTLTSRYSDLLKANSDIYCDSATGSTVSSSSSASDTSSDDDTTPLDNESLAGIMMIHGIISVVTFICAVLHRMYKRRRGGFEHTNQLSSMVQAFSAGKEYEGY